MNSGFEKLPNMPRNSASMIGAAFICLCGYSGSKAIEPEPKETSTQKSQSAALASWPMGPEVKPTKGELRVNLFSPSAKAPQDDPLQVNAHSKLAKGTLVYAPMLKDRDEPVSWQYFVFRGVNQQKTLGIQNSDVVTYQVGRGEDRTFDPLFSPDGESLVFKDGSPDTAFRLYVWHFKKRQLLRFSQHIAHPRCVWSPDSKNIAYFSHHRNPQGFYAPIKLLTFNFSTQKEQKIIENDGVDDAIWDERNNLFFTIFDEISPNKPRSEIPPFHDKHLDALIEGRARIVSASATTAKPQTVIERGIHPLPSPDGKWMAFWDLIPKEQTKTTSKPAIKLGLYLWNRATKKRTLLRQILAVSTRASRFELPRCYWSQDNRSLISVRSIYSTTSEGKGAGSAEIDLIPTHAQTDNNHAIKKLTTLKAFDFEPMMRSETSSQFQVLGNGQDAPLLFVKVTEAIGVDHGFTTEKQSLQAVDLRTGNVTSVAHFISKWNSVIGWDWRSES